MSRLSRSFADAIRRLAAGRLAIGRLATGLVCAWRISARTARLAIGIPDYDRYVAHVLRQHPGREPMGRDAFFHERMQARYGRGRSRCC